MYVPRQFAVEEHAEVLAMVRPADLGHLVVRGDDGFSSTPLPFVVDDELRTVRAHVARPNPLRRAAPCAALLVVPGRDAYVSPGWYPGSRSDEPNGDRTGAGVSAIMGACPTSWSTG